MLKNLIRLTDSNRRKIAEMCIALLPKVGYARVTHSGMVILKRSRWSLRRQRIPVTDLIMKYIPIEIGKLICRKEKRAVYIAMFHDKVATIVSLVKYSDKLDLLDTVYKEYVKACLVIDPSEDVLSFKEPIPSKLRLFSVDTDLNDLSRPKNKHKLSERIEKLRSKIPFQTISIINLRTV